MCNRDFSAKYINVKQYFQFFCRHCNDRFGNRGALMWHMMEQHPNRRNDRARRPFIGNRSRTDDYTRFTNRVGGRRRLPLSQPRFGNQNHPLHTSNENQSNVSTQQPSNQRDKALMPSLPNQGSGSTETAVTGACKKYI